MRSSPRFASTRTSANHAANEPDGGWLAPFASGFRSPFAVGSDSPCRASMSRYVSPIDTASTRWMPPAARVTSSGLLPRSADDSSSPTTFRNARTSLPTASWMAPLSDPDAFFLRALERGDTETQQHHHREGNLRPGSS